MQSICKFLIHCKHIKFREYFFWRGDNCLLIITYIIISIKLIFIRLMKLTGYYRVNYDYKTWQDITDFLKSDKYSTIHEINRAALIDDLLNLGRAEQLNYSVVLNATQYLVNETNYIPWRAFFNGLTYVQKQLEQKDNYNAFVVCIGK